MAKKIYQLQIVLKDIDPNIWRRILVDSDMTLRDFHKVIQTTMGWTNSHLHLFFDGQHEYSPEEFQVESAKDSNKTKLGQILKTEGSQVIYEYDFGDGWVHDIILEKIMEPDARSPIPVCLDGARNCPPEDCGGIFGYMEMLEVLKDPGHEEYEDYKEWLGEVYDPVYFNKDGINKLLQQKDYGCVWLE